MLKYDLQLMVWNDTSSFVSQTITLKRQAGCRECFDIYLDRFPVTPVVVFNVLFVDLAPDWGMLLKQF